MDIHMDCITMLIGPTKNL